MIYTIEEARRIVGVHNRIHGATARARKDAEKLGAPSAPAAPRTWSDIQDQMLRDMKSAKETRKELADIEKLLSGA